MLADTDHEVMWSCAPPDVEDCVVVMVAVDMLDVVDITGVDIDVVVDEAPIIEDVVVLMVELEGIVSAFVVVIIVCAKAVLVVVVVPAGARAPK